MATAPAPPPAWADLDVDPADLVVIVGGAELGPYGSSRTRFEMEVDNELSAAGVLELAWTTGLIKWEDDPKPGWYDTESGDLVDEAELVERYHDAVVERVRHPRVRRRRRDRSRSRVAAAGVGVPGQGLHLRGVVGGRRARVRASSTRSTPSSRPVPDTGDWQVIRKAGTEIRVPRKTKLSRTVGGADPDRVRPDGVGHQRRTWRTRSTGWRCGTSSRPSTRSCPPGFTPTELMRWVHPSLVASTQGTGMGGMTSMQTMYHGNLLGRNKPNDILQEVLPNVVAAHVIQSYVGSYGSMIHPVGACATAAVSVEEGVDKIRLGKAELVVAGGFDDLTLEADHRLR